MTLELGRGPIRLDKPNEQEECRAPAAAPGNVGPQLKQGKPDLRNKVTPEDSEAKRYQELLILESAEWIKFLTALGANATAPIKDTITELHPALKKLGLWGKAAIRTHKGKEYVVISGYAGLRKILTGTRYLATNAKVADLVIGTARLAKSAVGSTALSIALVVAADLLEAVLGSVLEDKDFLTQELGFTLLVNLHKQALAGLVGFLAGAAISVAGAPVFLPIAAGIVVGIVVGNALDAAIPTDEIVKAMGDIYLENLPDRLMRAYNELEREILWRIWPHERIPFPF